MGGFFIHAEGKHMTHRSFDSCYISNPFWTDNVTPETDPLVTQYLTELEALAPAVQSCKRQNKAKRGRSYRLFALACGAAILGIILFFAWATSDSESAGGFFVSLLVGVGGSIVLAIAGAKAFLSQEWPPSPSITLTDIHAASQARYEAWQLQMRETNPSYYADIVLWHQGEIAREEARRQADAIQTQIGLLRMQQERYRAEDEARRRNEPGSR